MTNVYQVNIEGVVTEVSTLAEVKSLLGDTKVTKKAIEAGQYPMIVIASADTEEVEATEPTDLVEDVDTTEEVDTTEVADEVEDDTTEEVDEPTDTEEDTVDEPTDEVPAEYVVGAMAIISDDSANEELLEWIFEAELPNDEVTITAVDKESGNIEVKGYDGAVHYTDLTVTAPPKAPKAKTKARDVNPEVDGYPEVGYFADEPAMKKYIKKLTNEQLYEWCAQEGAEYNEHDNPSINRMRAAMAIKAKHFTHLSAGNGKSKSKKKSKYSDYSNEQLAQLCLDNDVDVRDAKGDTRIERMYMIMDLRNAGVLQ